ncbi:PREDICTED: polycomb protein Sfmbt isoform X2 [Nicrophorus vespilloides]|nr:PREDICTED: polycomb protein Sfmbt isoform X2 [Nicrophorus vespilloides]
MPGMADMGMVWMGSGQTADMSLGLMPTDSGEILLDHETTYYPSHHSTSNHSMDDLGNIHNSPMVMDGLDLLNMGDSNDSSYTEEDAQQVYMITTATQTLPCPTKKIKPIKHPGLVLKTPIAYQSNTDPSVIPIHKDGIAVCEKCGAIGVKHAFYTRERRFCSMACARGYIPDSLPNTTGTQTPDSQFSEHQFKMDTQEDMSEYSSDQPFPQLPKQDETPIDDNLTLIRRTNADIMNSYDWDVQLKEPLFVAAPVKCFPSAPMCDSWDNIMVGMKVEVENTDCDNISDAFPDSFWVATVIKIIGYKALLRYEGFGQNITKDFWISLCSNQVHPVGWCASIGKPLIPPKTIENKYSDWKEFLRKRLTGARTLPSNFGMKISDSLKSRFKCGLNLEVVDKNRISQVKIAMVHRIVGKRLNVKYYDMTPEDTGFWCHEDSPLLHPVGWAKRVGHHIVAPSSYIQKVNDGTFDDNDATDDLFNAIQVGSKDKCTEFAVGMKLEAIDPLNLSSICAATVMDVLNCGYIMIRIDTYESDATGADWFCYHKNSPCIFPVGFCLKNSITLTPPKGYEAKLFSWPVYLLATSNVPIPENLLNSYIPPHGFKEGMKIEAADLMDPRLVCVATIARVVGRLLKVHFDGWEEEYDQWLDCYSPDIYPVGWCFSVGHKLEGPPVPLKQGQKLITPTKGIKRKGRKKKIKDSPPKTSFTKTFKREEVLKQTSSVAKSSDSNEEIDVDIDEVVDEPETGAEPAGPDQSLPVSTEPSPPSERKVSSYITSSNSNASTKHIPRLVDSSGGSYESNELCPNEWNVFDVAQFLRVNDCANYCDNFSRQRVDGKMLLNLNKEDILNFTGGKVGPSLKIYDLVQQLKMKLNPLQSRHMKANIKKIL